MIGNVMEYFKPGEYMRMMFYSVMTQAYSEKEIHNVLYKLLQYYEWGILLYQIKLKIIFFT